ncbi:DUF2570 domain-containing protein [Klebsiella michiganensis]|uniref:DUF2570 domain-containing protein n=1 Tax=Klebsiella michiganensis TaxID=1134687 RepID=UPI00287E670A|nr:DUF2570 domain-containing protein [Klebsiella michiganensis]MDS7886330.1 DUF2570 domain-containing protein [Klebsiella michiganensis]
MTAEAILALVKKFWLPALIIVLIGALAISASHYKDKAEQEKQRADGAEQQVNAAQTITANVLTTMSIFNSITEANQHAKEQIALDASGAASDIKVAVANDDCAPRDIPAGAVKRLQQFADSLRQSSGGPVTVRPDD